MGQVCDRMKARRMWVQGMGGGNPNAPTAQVPQAPQNIDLGAIQKLLLQNVAQAQQNQQTYGNLLNDREGYTQNAENGVGDQAQNLIDKGVNGVSVSPAETVAPVLNFHTENANKTADYVNRMFGFGTQANEGLGALANIVGQQNQNAIAQHEQNRADFEAGYDPTSGTVSGTSPRITDYTNQIMGGQANVNDVPVGLRPIVQNELNKKGYDPALAINSYVKDLEDTFNGGSQKDTLAHGNNPVQSLLDTLGGVIAPIHKSAREQRVEDYNTKKVAFQTQLNSLVTTGRIQPKVAAELVNSLPKADDTPQQANELFGTLETQIRNAYYNGGPRPTSQGQGVQLKSPTGQVYHYDNANDPEIKQAFKAGYRQL